jgi:murein DD-endopeptidase MepM/ murein hydrolase activator NlpD
MKMYIQSQYKNKGKVWDTRLKKLSKQLMAVFIIMLVLMLLKYTKSSVSVLVNKRVKSVFYFDLTQNARNVLNKAYPEIKAYFDKITNNVKEEEKFALSYLPVEGSITSPFGKRQHPTTKVDEIHTGMDIDAKLGTEVKVIFDGVVEKVEDDQSLGLVVVVDHGNGYKSIYGHLSEVKTNVGDNVKKGDIIALTGNSGVSTGPHLHFEIQLNDQPVDPQEFLN